jgi:hypothetical protein
MGGRLGVVRRREPRKLMSVRICSSPGVGVQQLSTLRILLGEKKAA